jgi:hypothetical protein
MKRSAVGTISNSSFLLYFVHVLAGEQAASGNASNDPSKAYSERLLQSYTGSLSRGRNHGTHGTAAVVSCALICDLYADICTELAG